MKALSFKTRKLKGSVINVRIKAGTKAEMLEVYGVTNKEGLVKTGKDVSANTSNYLIVKGKQLAYNPYRINIGSLGLAPRGFRGIVSPAYVVFETKSDIVPEFLFHYLKSPLGKNLIKWYGDRGGVRSSLRFNDLTKIDFPDISKEQQKKALEVIKDMEGNLGPFLEEQSIQTNLIQKLPQAILQEAVSGKLVPQNPNDEPALELLKKIKVEKEKLIKQKKIKRNKPLPPITDDEITYNLPENWEWVRLGDIAIATQGVQIPKSEQIHEEKEGYIRYLYISDFLNDDRKKYVKNCYPNKIVTGNDLIMVNTGATSGKVFKGKHGVLSNNLFYISFPHDYIKLEYLYLFLLSNCFSGRMQLKGGANPHMGHKKFRQAVMMLPPYAEQERIVMKVIQLMILCDELEVKVKENQNNSGLLMESVLQEAFEMK